MEEPGQLIYAVGVENRSGRRNHRVTPRDESFGCVSLATSVASRIMNKQQCAVHEGKIIDCK